MCPNLFAYLPIVEPLRMEFDQLLVREKAFTFIVLASVFSYWFKPEPISVKTHYANSYPQFLAYFSIVKRLFMEFDQLLVSEQASTASHLSTRAREPPCNDIPYLQDPVSPLGL
jgi:hypothetical protein